MRSHDSLHYHSSGNHMVDAERRLIGDDDGLTDEDTIDQEAHAALSALLNCRSGSGSDALFAYLHENLIENLLSAAKGDRVDMAVKYGSCASAKELLSTMALEWARNRVEGRNTL